MTDLDPTRCGGCQGAGAHRRYCPRHPDYHPWRRLADQAESIGDGIGSNEPGLANQAYALAAGIRAAMPHHPWRPLAVREARIAELEAITEETRRLDNLEGLE